MNLLKILLVCVFSVGMFGCAEFNELIGKDEGDNSSQNTNPLAIQLFASDWTVVGGSKLLETEATYNLRLNDIDLSQAIVSWDLVFKGANCDLQTFTDENGTANQAQLMCTTWGEAAVEVVALFENGREYRAIRNVGVIDSNPGGGDDGKSYRVYRVLDGTGGKVWGSNGWLQSSGDPARGTIYVGQVLRIINEDDTNHQPEGLNGLNCARSPFPLVNGQSYDCEITQELLDSEEYIVDNLNSTEGRLTLKSIDAERIYSDQFTCTACHGNKIGASRSSIENAIRMDIPAMKYLEAELDRDDGLTANEKLDAMVWWLNNGN